MDIERRNAIAYAVLKQIVKDGGRFSNIPDLKRKVGNLAKQTGFPADEIMEFAKMILREVFDEQLGFVGPKYEE